MAGYVHLVCLFWKLAAWHVYLDVEVTPASTKVHTISASLFSTNSREFGANFCKRIFSLFDWLYLAYKPWLISQRTVFFSHIKPANGTFSHDL